MKTGQTQLIPYLNILFNLVSPSKKHAVYEIDFQAETASRITFKDDGGIVLSKSDLSKFIRSLSNSVREEYTLKLTFKWEYLKNSAEDNERVVFGPIETLKHGADGSSYWINPVAVKSGGKIYLLIVECTQTAGTDATSAVSCPDSGRCSSQDSDSSRIPVGNSLPLSDAETDFFEKFLYASSYQTFSQILSIDLKSFDVEEISVCPDSLRRKKSEKKWNEYVSELWDKTCSDDQARFVRYTAPEVLSLLKPGEINRFNIRSSAFSSDGKVKWYLAFVRRNLKSAFIFFIDVSDVIASRNKIINDSILKESQYKRAIIADAIYMFEFNLTQDKVLGDPVRKVGGRLINMREEFDVAGGIKYSDFVNRCASTMYDDEKKTFLKKMNIDFLKRCFSRGIYEESFDTKKVGYGGTVNWYRTVVLMAKDDYTGDIMGLSFTKNITCHYAQEEEKLYQNELITGLSNDYSNVYAVLFGTGKIRTVRLNDSLGAFYDESQGEMAFEDALDFYVNISVYDDDKDMLRMAFSVENIRRQLGNAESFSFNFRSFINGIIAYMKVKCVRIGKAEDFKGFLLAFMNIDEEMKQNLEQRKLLQDALEVAQKANKAKTIFLSNMSHDIRTPMNAITGFTRIAKTCTNDSDKVMEYLEKIQSSSNHLLNLINDVLDFSRIESGKVKVSNSVTDMESVVFDVDNVLRQQAELKHIDFVVKKSGDLKKKVLCDKLRLNQILINLVSNAVKYTKDNGTVVFKITEVPPPTTSFASYEFDIKDNGIGMSKEFQKHLFESFEREETAYTRKIQGTGLGLAITKNLIDLMGGSVNVVSEEGKGTQFIVTFDFKLENEKHSDSGLIEEHEVAPKSVKKDLESEINPDDFKGIKVLLVEDNDLNRDIARVLLNQVGIEVDEAENGMLGVGVIRDKEPGYYDCVLMDVQMPVMNGYEATRAIRELGDIRCKTPVVAMTANAFEEDRQNASKSGMNSFVIKPFEMPELLGAIKEMSEETKRIFGK